MAAHRRTVRPMPSRLPGAAPSGAIRITISDARTGSGQRRKTSCGAGEPPDARQPSLSHRGKNATTAHPRADRQSNFQSSATMSNIGKKTSRFIAKKASTSVIKMQHIA
jgi:hypothetical protein